MYYSLSKTPLLIHVLKKEISNKNFIENSIRVTDFDVVNKLYKIAISLPERGQIKIKMQPKCIYEVLFYNKDE